MGKNKIVNQWKRKRNRFIIFSKRDNHARSVWWNDNRNKNCKRKTRRNYGKKLKIRKHYYWKKWKNRRIRKKTLTGKIIDKRSRIKNRREAKLKCIAYFKE